MSGGWGSENTEVQDVVIVGVGKSWCEFVRGQVSLFTKVASAARTNFAVFWSATRIPSHMNLIT